MNRLLGKIVVLVTVIVAVFLALNIAIRPKKDYVLAIKPAQIAELRLQSKEGTITLQKKETAEGKVWTVSEGSQTVTADEKTVQVLFAVMARIEFVEKFKDSEFGDDLHQLDLGKTAEIQIRTQSGDEITLQIGRESPAGTEYYATISNKPHTIYTIPNQFSKYLVHGFADLRSRQLIPLLGASHVKVQLGDKVWEISKGQAGWSSPLLSPDSVEKVLKGIRSLRFINYFDEPPSPESLAKYGLTVPDIEITVDARHIFQMSRYDARFYMTSPQSPWVFILHSSPANAFTQLLLELVK